MVRKSLGGVGKMSSSEAKASKVYSSHEVALAVAARDRRDGLRAQVKVVKTRRGIPLLWGVFVTLKGE